MIRIVALLNFPIFVHFNLRNHLSLQANLHNRKINRVEIDNRREQGSFSRDSFTSLLIFGQRFGEFEARSACTVGVPRLAETSSSTTRTTGVRDDDDGVGPNS